MMRTALVLVGVGSVGLCGCHAYDCREWSMCGEPPLEAPATCDPAAGPLDERCGGVYVSNTAGSDDNTGTRSQPVRTMQKALALAQTGPRRVYACAEVFLEPVVVPAGVEFWGGLDCAAGWAYVGSTNKTTIAPEPGTIALRFLPGTGRAIVGDVRAEAADAMHAGGSSIAALVSSGATVEIIRSELVAGYGAAGAPGKSGGELPATAGKAGLVGGAACSVNTVPGGQSVVNSCRGIDSVGAQGGYGDQTLGGNGSNGEPEPEPNPLGQGLGGTGWANGSLCLDGLPGAAGAHGAHGLGARGPGKLGEEGWQGEPGQAGADAAPGQGGGGGGGSRGGATFCGAAPKGGASGGGGGTGGCGGVGGKGGGYGGASIGLLSLGADVIVRATTITTGPGGDGGAGGPGQGGGLPGIGGNGGVGMNLSPAGCRGGDGGAGGDGGHGGGGLGGPSVGILHMAGLPPTQEHVDIRIDEAGSGGPGGSPGVPGSAGEDGFRGEVRAFPP